MILSQRTPYFLLLLCSQIYFFVCKSTIYTMPNDAEVQEAKELIAELCSNLYNQGHVSGTGGGISIKVGDLIVMAPSGVQKERMRCEDMFVLDTKGDIVYTPEARPPPYKPPKLSECAPLFMSVRLFFDTLMATTS